MRNTGLEEAQAGIKISGRYADDTTLMAESEEELKNFFMKLKESEKVGLKLNIQKTKITASDPITSWQIDGETVEIVADFILGAPKSLQTVIAATTSGELLSPEGSQEGKDICYLAATRLQPLLKVSPEVTQGVNTQDTAPA